ncbi:MAG: hypothetical protein ACE5JI_16535, partial [Acidobacteriota bacterium]
MVSELSEKQQGQLSDEEVSADAVVSLVVDRSALDDVLKLPETSLDVGQLLVVSDRLFPGNVG